MKAFHYEKAALRLTIIEVICFGDSFTLEKDDFEAIRVYLKHERGDSRAVYVAFEGC